MHGILPLMSLGLPLPHWLVILSAFISIAGASAYIRDTLKGTTKPNRVSYGMWALAPMIGVAAALAAHADPWTVVRTFLAGLTPLLVLIVSFLNTQSYWKLTLFDFFCGACSLIALIVWGFADSPRSAILLAAIGDGFATLPTVFKAWRHPQTETGITYVAGLIGVLLVLPSIPRWDIENSAFQIYLILANIALIFSIYRKKIFKLA